MRDLLSPPLAFCAHRTACCRCFCCFFDLPGPLLVCPRRARVSHSALAAFCVHAAVSMMQRREQHAPPRRHAVADADHARRERGAGTALLPRSLLVCHLTPLTRSLRQPSRSTRSGCPTSRSRPRRSSARPTTSATPPSRTSSTALARTTSVVRSKASSCRSTMTLPTCAVRNELTLTLARSVVLVAHPLLAAACCRPFLPLA